MIELIVDSFAGGGPRWGSSWRAARAPMRCLLIDMAGFQKYAEGQ